LTSLFQSWRYTEQQPNRKDTDEEPDPMDSGCTLSILHGLGRQPLHAAAAAVRRTRQSDSVANQLLTGHLRHGAGPRPADRRGAVRCVRAKAGDHGRVDLIRAGELHYLAG